MAGYEAGRVWLKVVPSFDGVQQRISRESAQWGRDAGKQFRDAYEREVARGRTPAPGPSRQESSRQGGESGDAFSRAFRRQVEAALRSLPPAQIGAATTEAEQKIRDLRQDLERLSNQNIGVDIDAGAAFAEIQRIKGELQRLNSESADVQVRANTAGAIASLEALERKVRSATAGDATIEVDVRANDGSFAAQVRAAIQRAQAALPRIELDADASDVDVEIQRIRGRLEALGNKRIGIDISAADAAAQIAALQARLERLQAGSTDIRVQADAAAAAGQLAAVQAQVDRLDGRTARVDVDSSSINSFSGRLLLLGSAITALAPALVPIGGIATVSLGAIGAAATTAIPAVAALVLGFQGVGEALKQMGKVQEEAGQVAAKNAAAAQQQAQAQASAARQVESAQASLANAQANAAQAQVRATAQVLDAEKALVRAREDGERRAVESARRVADAQAAVVSAEEDSAERVAAAVKRAMDAREAADREAVQSARRVADARRALAEAEESADKVARDSARELRYARRDLTEAQEDGSQRVSAALRRQQDAQEALTRANEDELRVTQDINDARREAAERLEDLSIRAQRGALSEQKAALDRADAEAEYQAVIGDDAASEEARERARIRFEEAKLQLQQLQLDNARLAAEQKDAQEKGVEGSDAVVAAQDRVVEAARRREAAERAAKDAADAVAAARVESAERVAEVEERLALVRQGRLDAIADAEQRVTDAQQGVADALEAQTQGQVDAAERIVEADAARVKAQEEGAERVAAAERALSDARVADERARVEAMERIQAAEESVGEAAASRLEQQRSAAFSLEQAERSLQGAREAAAAAAVSGGVAATAAMQNLESAMNKLSPVQQEFTRFLFGLRPLIGQLQDASAAGLLPGVQRGIEAMLPLMPTFERLAFTFGTALGSLFERAGQALAGPEFQGFYEFLETQGPGILSSLGTLTGSVFSMFNGLAQAFGPIAAETILALAGLTQRFADFLHAAGKNESFQNFLAYVKENTPAVNEFIGSLADAFVNIVRSMAPFGPIVLGIIGGIADFIASVPPGVLAGIVLGLLGIATAFQLIAGGAAALAAIGAVVGIIGATGAIVIPIIIAIGAALVAAYQHSDTFREKVGAAFSWLKETLAPLGETFKEFGSAVVDAVQEIAEAAVKWWHFFGDDLTEFARTAWDSVKLIFEGAVGIIGGIFTTFTGLLTGDWQKMWDGLKEIAGGFWDVIKGVLELGGGLVELAFDSLLKVGKSAVDGLLSPFTEPGGIVDDIVGFFSGIVDAVKEFLGIHSPSTVFAEIGQFMIDGLMLSLEAGVAVVTELWSRMWSGVKDVISLAWSFIRDEIFTPMGTFLTVTVPDFFRRSVDGVKLAFDVIKAVVQAPIDWIAKNIWLPLETFLKVTLPSWWFAARQGIEQAWDKVKAAVQGPIDWIKTHLWDPWFTLLTVTIPGWFTSGVTKLGEAWDVVKSKIQGPIDWVKTNLWDPWYTFLTSTVPGFFITAKDNIGTEWDKVAAKVSGPIDWIRDHIFSPWHTMLTSTVPGYFTAAADAIGKAWSAIRDKAREPVNFVIREVYTGGIKKLFDQVASAVSSDIRLPFINEIPAAARGAILPGMSSWRDGDDQLIMARRGEGIAVSEAMAVPEARKRLLTWNKLGVQGGPAAIRRYEQGMQGFAKGGIVDLGRWFAGKGARVGEHPAFGGVAPVHRGRGHYEGRAIDLNYGPGGENATEKAFFDKYAKALRSAGWTVYWRDNDPRGHSDHLHAEAPSKSFVGDFPGEGILAALGDALSGAFGAVKNIIGDLSPLDALRNAASSAFGGMPAAGAWGDLAKSTVGKMVGMAGDKLSSLIAAVNPFDGGSENDTPSAVGGGAARNKELGRQKAAARGWTGAQWDALDKLVFKESSWNHLAQNKTSTAYGLFQFLNSTWGSVGARKTSDPSQQIDAGFKYIAQRYGNPVAAWNFHRAKGWYSQGGIVDFPFKDINVPAMAMGGVVRARPGGTVVRLGEAGRDEAVVDAGLLNRRLLDIERRQIDEDAQRKRDELRRAAEVRIQASRSQEEQRALERQLQESLLRVKQQSLEAFAAAQVRFEQRMVQARAEAADRQAVADRNAAAERVASTVRVERAQRETAAVVTRVHTENVATQLRGFDGVISSVTRLGSVTQDGFRWLGESFRTSMGSVVMDATRWLGESLRRSPGSALPGQPMLFDQGGVVPPGYTSILNATRQPEALLNPQQWQDIRSVALDRSRVDRGVHFHGNVTVPTAADVARELMKKQRRAEALAV